MTIFTFSTRYPFPIWAAFVDRGDIYDSGARQVFEYFVKRVKGTNPKQIPEIEGLEGRFLRSPNYTALNNALKGLV